MPRYLYDSESMAAETASLSLLEQGVYRALLDAYVNVPGIDLPEEGSCLTEGENLKFLASLIGAKSEAELVAIRKIVMMFFKREGGELTVPRLQHLAKSVPPAEGESVRVTGNASDRDPLAIPFGVTDSGPQWWAPTEEVIAQLQATYRCLDVVDVIVDARMRAMQPGQRPISDPLGYLHKRFQASMAKLQERFAALGLPQMVLGAPKFAGFVRSYPRQTDVAGAWQVWSALGIEDDPVLCEKIANGLARWKRSIEWQQLGGEAIPTAAHFLMQEKWHAVPRLSPAEAGRLAATSVVFPGGDGEARPGDESGR